jgi:DnaJ-domain-containing protein 1
MGLTEIATAAVCAVLGYVLVSSFMPKSPEDMARAAAARARGGIDAPPPPASPAAAPNDWPAVLGVPRSASWEEIASAYRRLVSQYHPDKVSQMGEEIRRVATRKTQELNIAYEQAMREKG